jgi:hypothetical protein
MQKIIPICQFLRTFLYRGPDKRTKP